MSIKMEDYKIRKLDKAPINWNAVRLKDICDVRSEKFNPLQNENCKYIALEHLQQVTGKLINFGDSIETSSIKSKFYKNDILFGKLRPYLKKYLYAEFDGVCSTEIVVLKTKPENDSLYNFYLIQQDKFIEYLSNKSFGTKMPRTSWDIMGEYKLFTPPLKEQQKIASILLTIDNLIENTDHLINSYTLLKKGLMQTLLTKGIGHNKFKKTETGEIPEDWEFCKLGRYIKLLGGFAFRSSNFTDTGIKILRISNIKDNSIDFNEYASYPIDLVKDLKEFILEESDVVIAMSGATTGKIGLVSREKLPCLLNQRVGKFKIIDYNKINKRFIFYLTNMSYFQNKIWDFAIGDAQPNISGLQIESIEVAVPPIKEQLKISEILNYADMQINLYKEKKEYLNLLKKGLMQQLLTGKIRVRV